MMWVVAYMTHTETLENGVTTIKLIGKLLREKITIEGLFTIVLRTGVNEGKILFLHTEQWQGHSEVT